MAELENRERRARAALDREVWLAAEAPELLRLLHESYFEFRTWRRRYQSTSSETPCLDHLAQQGGRGFASLRSK